MQLHQVAVSEAVSAAFDGVCCVLEGPVGAADSSSLRPQVLRLLRKRRVLQQLQLQQLLQQPGARNGATQSHQGEGAGGGDAAISRHTDGSKLQLLLFFSQTCLDRNPEAFKPKIGKGKQGESDRRHSKGCNCKRSGCLKNYCECYEVGPPFTPPGRPPCASSRFF